MIKLMLTILCLLSFSTSAATNEWENDAMVKLVFAAMNDCYVHQHKDDVPLAECIYHILLKSKNPNKYRFRLYKDKVDGQASKINILIYNKKGFILHCTGYARDTIEIEACKRHQGKGLTNEQLMYIDLQ